MKSLLTYLSLSSLLLLAACSTTRYEGGKSTLNIRDVKCLIIPFDNATDNEAASVAITQMTASCLDGKNVDYTYANGDERKAQEGKTLTWKQVGEESGYTHLLRGNVHEYHYKTDLDGDPAVGLSMRLINISTGKTDWQGSSSVTGYTYASVSSASQRAVNKLVRNMFTDLRCSKK